MSRPENQSAPLTRLRLLFTTATLSLALALALAGQNAAAGQSWPPKGWVIAEKSTSPDGHYGILIPPNPDGDEADAESTEADEPAATPDAAATAEPSATAAESATPSPTSAEDDETDEGERDCMADLTKHLILGKLTPDYFQHANHRSLQTWWSPDSNWCVVEDGARFGSDSVYTVEIKEGKVTETEIGAHIQKACDAIISKLAHEPEDRGDCIPEFRLRADRKVQARVISSTNPKRFEDSKTYCAFFEGTYDLATKKWTRSNARKISLDAFDALNDSRGGEGGPFLVVKEGEQPPDDFDGTIVSSADEIPKFLDDRLNAIYQALHFSMAPGRFSKLKEEQRTWLKKRDALTSAEEKNKLTQARIKELTDAAWQ